MRPGWIAGRLPRPLFDVRVHFDRDVDDVVRDAFLEGVKNAGVPDHPDPESATAENLADVLRARHEASKQRHE